MGKWMQGFMDRLEKSRARALEGGGPERLAALARTGRLSARERIGLLADPGTFEEIGGMVHDPRPSWDGGKRPAPGDGVVMGTARVDGRLVCVYALDFSVMSGSLGSQAAWKLEEISDMAARFRAPLIGMVDSAGTRLGVRDGDVGQDGLARLVRTHARISGIVPRITLVLGPATGLFALVPALSDFTVMHGENGFLWLGGEKEDEDAGLAEFSMERSGQCDFVAESDAEAVAIAKELLSFLPSSSFEKPPRIETNDDPGRRDEGLLDVMPDDPRQTYDIHEIIEKITDNGEFFEIKEDFATHLTIGFARFGGDVAGIVANNPDELSGILEPDSSDKYDRFMNFLNAFDIPLVTLVDTTAFPPGDRWERAGVIRHGAKLLHSYSHLTCPKVTVVLRRSYGGANIVMGASKMRPDFIFGWPTAEFAPTGPETIVHTVFHKELAKAREDGNFEAVFESLLGMLKEQFTVMNLSRVWTSYYTVHEVIDPRETRPRIVSALAATRNKHETVPAKRRYIKPA